MLRSVTRRVNSSSSVVCDTTDEYRHGHEAAPEELDGDGAGSATQVVDVVEHGQSGPAFGVPGEVLGGVTEYLGSSTILSLRLVSRSFDEAPPVREEFVHRTAFALMRKEGAEGLRKALVLVASLPTSLQLKPLQALARGIGQVDFSSRSCVFDALAAAAMELTPFDRRALLMTLSENVYLIKDEERCASAWNVCWDGIIAINAIEPRGYEQSLVCLATACNAGVATGVWLERVERILEEVLKVDDASCRATVLAQLAASLNDIRGRGTDGQKIMSVYRKVRSAVSELDTQHPQTAVALGHLGRAMRFLPRADLPGAFKMAVFHALRLPPATQATGLMDVLEECDRVPDAMVAAAFSEILTAALELARTSEELWYVLYRVQDLFECLPDPDLRAAIDAVSAVAAECPRGAFTRGVVDKLLRSFSRLPDVDVLAALARLLPAIAQNWRQYDFFGYPPVAEIMGRLSPEDRRTVRLILWKEGMV